MSNPFSYENKRVVVTGGATGVGAGLLEVLAEQDVAHVTVLDLKEPTVPHSTFMQCDLSDQVAVVAAIAAIDGPVNVLFNNAGVADTLPPATVISVNYLALRALSEGLLPKIPEGGAIVNTASIAATTGGAGPIVYRAAKAAVVQFSKSAAIDLAPHNIRVNCIAPGHIPTGITNYDLGAVIQTMQPLQRHGTPADVAEAVLYLVSDRSAQITGIVMPIDGGTSAGPPVTQLRDLMRGVKAAKEKAEQKAAEGGTR